MRILAIDPGTEISAWVVYDGGDLLRSGMGENHDGLLAMFYDGDFQECNAMAIEMVACYGMAVGQSVFETCVWIGRFAEAWEVMADKFPHFVYRKEVTMHLCHSMRARDNNVRQAIIDRYPATGGGKTPQIGTKSKPGPLYGVSKDVWAALGVAITFDETKKKT